ncbi:MAG TPA: peptidase E [Thermoleophilaceae bacterium]|nr:peptidase E [Thermoleophilaceae bacterium]
MSTRAPLGSRRILAIGGGGFTGSVADGPLDHFVAALPGVERPRICLLPTASGDPDDQIERFYHAFRGLGRLSHLSLFRLGTRAVSPREHLLAQDVIYVGGGSLANLLAIWRVHALDETLTEAWERGIVLCGVSAGSMCWFEDAVTRSHGRSRTARGLGLLPGSNSVHYSSDPERRACYRTAILDGLPAGYGADDGVGLLFAGRDLADVVSARPDARAWRVHADEGRLVELSLSPRLLKPMPGAGHDAPVEIAEIRDARRARQAGARRSRPASGGPV